MNELAYIILLPGGSLLWMLGGWKWKGWRRFVLPLLFVCLCLAYSVSIARSVTLGIICLSVTSLPYGENSSWKQRIVTGISFGLIGLPLGIDLTMLAAPIVFITGWILSNKLKLQWKIVEGAVGFSVALPIANMLYGYIK